MLTSCEHDGRVASSERPATGVVTSRLEIRHPAELDRQRFVELFSDQAFMVFSEGVLSPHVAHARFDRMLTRCAEVPFAKQPIIERCSGMIVGYTGVGHVDLDGRRWLEWGYRLVPEARGKGYATEASRALLDVAARSYSGEILAIIDPANEASKRVSRKLGFEYWKQAPVESYSSDLYRRR